MENTIEKINPTALSKGKIEKVQKRDGQIVDFNQQKIDEAIYKAITAAGQGDGEESKKASERVIQLINRRFKNGEIPQVEQIQDIVEEVLILEGLVDTARSYILYREQRRRIREAGNIIDESSERIDKYLKELDWQIYENANMTFSLQGLNQYTISDISKKYWLNKIYPKEIREAAESEDFHIHDLESISTYCCGWDLYDLLKRGFGGVSSKLECRPPKHLRTALGQLVNFFYTVQGESAGAQAVSNFDTLMAPFIRYDNLSYPQIKQAVQEFLYNCMVPTRVGFQTPFLNVTLDIKPPDSLGKQPVIIGGEIKEETYNQFQAEMDMFNRAFYEGLMEGDAKGRPFTFPIPTVSITKDFDWDNPALNPLWEATAKYGVNYFQNFVKSDMNPEDFRSMCVTPDTQIIYKNTLGSIGKMPIRRIVEDFIKSGNLGEVLMNGEFVKIKNVLRLANKAGYVLKITLENGETFRITPDHPSMVVRGNKLVECQSEKLKVGDEIPIAKNPYKGELGDFDLGRFVGLYIAEGYLAHNEATTAFSFCSKEKDYFDFVTKLAQKRFGAKTTIKIEEKHQSLVAIINDRAVGALVKSYVRGDNSLNKQLASKLFGMSFEFRKGVLIGILEGDGHISKIDSTRNIQINSSNSGLVDDIGLLCRSLGINYTKQINFNNTHFGVKFTSYKLLLTNDFPEWLAKYFNKKLGKSRIYKNYKNFCGLKIKSIEKIPYTDQVYDFETKNKNHLFQLANGVITHNCCRLRLNNKELYKRGGGLFGSQPLTGSIGVVTINLPRIGYLSKTKKEFFERLGHLMNLAKESLEIKRKALDNFMEKGLYPFSKNYLSSVKKMRNSYFGNHFSTIGLMGMNEALLNFLGKDMADSQGKSFALEVLDFMRDKLVKYQEETSYLYNLEATPGEGTSYRQARADKDKYPDIITAGTSEFPYYTNSSQLPVNYTDDVFEALKLQDDIQCKYTGGCIEKENRVLTDKGLLPIENIVNNFNKLKPIRALSYNPEKKISEWDEILEAVEIDVKKHNKIRIKGERNLDIVTSDWHPFFILEKFKPNPACPICEEKVGNLKGFAVHIRWNLECQEEYKVFPKYRVVEKRADELKVGDYILQNSSNLYSEKETSLNNDLMWLIGFFVGDGSISEFIDNRGGNNLRKYKIRFFSEHQDALEKISQIINKYFECNVKVIKNDKRSKLLREVSSSKKEISEFLFRYGFQVGKKVYDVFIPNAVKDNITKDNVFSLLSGLMDSDGHLGKRNGDFEYYTVSSHLADDILEICSLAGIMISKSKKETKRENEVDIWRLRIPTYEVTRIKNQLINTFHSLRIKSELSNRKKRHLPVVRVKEVSKVNVKDNQFYDLTTKKNHNYLAGKDCLVFIHNTVLHVFLGERINDPEMAKKLVKKIFENFHLPYITLTPTFSICPSHGYLSGEHFNCPKCAIEQPCEVYSRIVGYIRPVRQWHIGKKQEFKERKEFKIEAPV